MHAQPTAARQTCAFPAIRRFCAGVLRTGRLESFTLVEVLITVAILGILGALALPAVSRVAEAGAKAKAQRNAQTIAAVSSALASTGEAHVLPESLGGALATAMILREGVVVSQGAFSGQLFTIGGMNDEELERAVDYLKIIYDLAEVRMVYDPLGGA